MEKTEHQDRCCNADSPKVESKILNHIEGSSVSTFSVLGMDCADEIAAIQKSLTHSKIAKVTANLMTSQVSVEHDPSFKKEEIVALINKSGVKVQETSRQLSFVAANKNRVILVSLSGVFLVIGLICQWFLELPNTWLFSIYLTATLTGGALIFPKAVRALKQRILDMNVLMTMAAVGAFAIREYSEAAAVVFLFSLAEMLEAFSVARARKAIREVLSITPQVATLVAENGNISSTPVEEIAVGQKILIRAGDRVPLDALIVEGSSYLNQAPLTGESQPVSKGVGDTVLAGTVNESGSLTAIVSHGFKDTKIAGVIRLIEEAQSKKAPSQLFVDKFAKIYTPIVTLVALLVFLIPPLLFSQSWDLWFYRSLVFLVIACPCALVIATPVSVVSALTALAKNGVLVKGGVYLEALGKLRAIAVDKTGTITEGRPKVVSEKTWGSSKTEEFMQVALSLEKQSNHPLAKAVVEFCESKHATDSPVSNHKVIPGKGVEGSIGSHHYFAGNHKLAHELNVCSPEVEKYLQTLEDQAKSVMIVGHKPHAGCEGEILGILGLADKPREGVGKAIENLHRVGIKEILILSGDNQRTVDSIAKIVGIDKGRGDLLPEDKVSEIQSLTKKYLYVGMVGDGINDAPALAQASVGIAMGAAGTDAAIETADIALMTDDLGQLARAIHHGRKTLGIIRFNIGFALAIKAVFIGLGVFGLSNLWLAVAADMGASLIVIANSLRLLGMNSETHLS
jgi:Cd2+/Zn2+-exporting ATPase